MNFDIGIYEKSDLKEIVKFLNSKARCFYQSEHSFKSAHYESFFKANLQVAMVDIERTIRGTFGCDIYLKNINLQLFRKMFPNGCKNIFKIESDKDVKLTGQILETLRNMNSHARLTERDYQFFDMDFSHLERQPKMNNSIRYFDGEITIAGMIFIICNFLREQSITTLIKSDFLFSVVISGRYCLNKGDAFVRHISHVNLECLIRRTSGETLKEAIFGDSKTLIKENKNRFELKIGVLNYPTTKISGEIYDNKVIVDNYSLGRIYFKKKYELEIDDLNGFIELSNQLPSFALVEYLYTLGIDRFDETQNKIIRSNFSAISKLNQPKFYINKNINVILLPETVSDFTLISSLFSDSLLKFLLTLEEVVYSKREIPPSEKGLSSIGYALYGINAPDYLVKEVKYLRNFVAHGYLLNETLIYADATKEYSVDFVLETLNNLMVFFKENHNDLFEITKPLLSQVFIEKVCNAKYKKAISLSQNTINTFPEYDAKDLFIKNNAINHSFFDIEKLNALNDLVNGGTRVLKISIEGLTGHLYLKNIQHDCDLLRKLCKKHNLKIVQNKDCGIINCYTLLKDV